MDRQAQITRKLKESFHPQFIEVRDDSHLHAGHNEAAAGGGTHLSITIVSDRFEGKKQVERHKMVYAVLKEDMDAGLHAVAIKAATTKNPV